MPHRERKYISAALILIAACFFFTRGWFVPLRGHLVSAVSPVEQPVRAGVGALTDSFSRLFYLWSLDEENEHLSSKVSELLAENGSLREENEQLRQRLANLEEHVRQYPALRKKRVLARVIYRDIYHMRAEMEIDRGSEHGVRKNCAVLSGRAVVGKVIQVGPRVSKVRLLLDPRCAVSAVVGRGAGKGMVSGRGEGDTYLRLEYYDRRKEIKVGDGVFTTGFDGYFEQNMFVGEVVEVVRHPNNLFPDVSVKAAGDFSRLTEVIVLIPEE